MTDSSYPGAPTPPPADPRYGQAPAYNGAPSGPVPGKTLGIVAFVLSFFVQLVALILGIVALVQSRRAGAKNGWAVAAIIISIVLMVIGAILLVLFFGAIMAVLSQCGDLGSGQHMVDGILITCP